MGRQNTIRIDYGALPNKPGMQKVQTFCAENLGLKRGEVIRIQSSRALGVTFVTVVDLDLALKVCEEHNKKHELTGSDKKQHPVTITIEDGTVLVKLYDLSEDVPNTAVAKFLEQYGEVRDVYEETLDETQAFAGAYTGVRIAKMVVKQNIGSWVVINFELTNLSYFGQRQTCKHCHDYLHVGVGCVQNKKLLVQKTFADAVKQPAKPQQPALPQQPILSQQPALPQQPLLPPNPQQPLNPQLKPKQNGGKSKPNGAFDFSSYNLASININNITNATKVDALRSFIRTLELDIVFLQEVENERLTIPGFNVICNVDHARRGTAIALKDHIVYTHVEKSLDGRLIALRVQNTTLCNVYAPSGTALRTERERFFNGTLAYYLRHNTDHIVLAGDFNCVLRPCDSTSSNPSAALQTAVQQIRLHDVWLKLHPNTHAPTYVVHNAESRLDRVYVSAGLCDQLRTAATHSFTILAHGHHTKSSSQQARHRGPERNP
ncbi:hypothetical protein quinque_008128 [Culex quinquefasciatus]